MFITTMVKDEDRPCVRLYSVRGVSALLRVSGTASGQLPETVPSAI